MPNELVRQRNMQSVLHSAMGLFVAQGVENTSIEAIARCSNLSLRSVMNYFHTRNELVVAVLDYDYANELEEMESFFASQRYCDASGAEQVMQIVTVDLDKAIEHCDIVFCTTQLQSLASRVSDKAKDSQPMGNWRYVMKRLQDAFEKGVSDGSIPQVTVRDLLDVKTIMLSLRGLEQQIAFAMRDKELKKLLEPEKAVVKYKRQMELLLKAK